MKKRRIWFVFKRLIIKLFITYIYILSIIRSNGLFQSLFNYKSVEKYKSVVEDFEEYLTKENVYNPVDIFDYFNYALWNGYLSYNHEFSFNLNRDIFLNNAGMGCIKGDSVCLNNADFLRQVFSSYGYKSYVVNCYINHAIVDNIRTNSEIERIISDESSIIGGIVSSFAGISYIVGNHSITCVEYQDSVYYFDPTNFVYLGKRGINDLSIINGEGNFTIKYLSSTLYNSFKVIIDTFNNSPEEFNICYLNTLDNVEIDVQELDLFYEEHKDIYADIEKDLSKKNQILLIIICSVLTACLTRGVKSILQFLNFTPKMENELTKKLSIYLWNNDIYGCKKVIQYLNYLIKNGYLSYEKNNNKYRIRVFLTKEYPSLAFVDEDYTYEYIKYYYKPLTRYKVKKIKVINEKQEEEILFLNDSIAEKSYFYSIKKDKFYTLDESYNLVGEGEILKIKHFYQLVRLKHFPIMKDEIEKEFKINDKLANKFYEDNKDLIEKINKRLAYIPKK